MKQFFKRAAVLLSLGLTAAVVFHYAAAIGHAARNAAALSAVLLLPDGIRFSFIGTSAQREESETDTSSCSSSQPAASETGSPASSSSVPSGDNATGTIQNTTISLSAANTATAQVHISNKTDLKPDLETYLAQGLPFSLTDTSQPQVLIVHTHATEAYTKGDTGYYDTAASTRSTDNEKNTVRVGEAIAQVLNEAGIVTINDDTLHDSPNYTGSYTRSAQTIRSYLEKYPSIKVVIDGHRDAIAKNDSTKVKLTATVKGKQAAQVMILAGCETGSVENFPHWEENFRFCLQLQKQLEADYPNLARPLMFKACKYNFDLLNGSVLIEIGTDANTLEEAVYSGQLLGQALVKVLKP